MLWSGFLAFLNFDDLNDVRYFQVIHDLRSCLTNEILHLTTRRLGRFAILFQPSTDLFFLLTILCCIVSSRPRDNREFTRKGSSKREAPSPVPIIHCPASRCNRNSPRNTFVDTYLADRSACTQHARHVRDLAMVTTKDGMRRPEHRD